MRSMWHGITLPEVSCRVHPANRIVSQILLMIVGYARTSSLAQVAGLEAQERDLRSAGCDKIFREQVSSVAERQQLEAAARLRARGRHFRRYQVGSAGAVGWRPAGDRRPTGGQEGRLRVLSISGNQPLDTPRAPAG